MKKPAVIIDGGFSESGGAEGSRTPDLSSAIAALSQLSYGPSGCALMRGRQEHASGRADCQA